MGSLKLILGILVLVAIAFVGIKIIPPYFSNYEFEDAIKTEALQGTYSSRSEDDIREAILRRAREYDIPVTAKQIRVSRTGSNGAGSLWIEADYTVPLDLPGYSTTLQFHPSSRNKGVF